MKYSKRYIVLSIVLAIVFLLKFHILEIDDAKIGSFRGGNLAASAWNPLVANDVNGKEIKLVIDNREFSSKKIEFFMDDNRKSCSIFWYSIFFYSVVPKLCGQTLFGSLTADIRHNCRKEYFYYDLP